MYKSQFSKNILLGILIVMSIIQTGILWLGPLPGQNFFSQSQVKYAGIEPFGVWLVKPSASNLEGVSSFAYQLHDTIEYTQREYEHLVGKMQSMIQTVLREDSEKQKEQPIDWQQLLARPSIVYEYEVPLPLEAIGGIKNPAYTIPSIDLLVIQGNPGFGRSLRLYLVSTQNEIMYERQLQGDYTALDKIYRYFTSEEVIQGITKFQPSSLSNIKQYIKGNAFMPIASQHAPIRYEVLQSFMPLETSKPIEEQLEVYVNDFFVNPLLKEVEKEEDGTMIFTERSRNLVIYHPQGILEYLNLSAEDTSPQSLLGGYHRAYTMLQNTSALSLEVKRGLYLEAIKESYQGTTYYFNMAYNGRKVVLSEDLKKQLGMEAFAEVTVKNNEIVSSRWPILKIIPAIYANEIVYARLSTEYVDPINKALGDGALGQSEYTVVEAIDTVYVMTALEGKLYMKRGISLKNTWYYP